MSICSPFLTGSLFALLTIGAGIGVSFAYVKDADWAFKTFAGMMMSLVPAFCMALMGHKIHKVIAKKCCNVEYGTSATTPSAEVELPHFSPEPFIVFQQMTISQAQIANSPVLHAYREKPVIAGPTDEPKLAIAISLP